MLYNVKEAAERLGLSPAAVYDMVRANSIPHRRVGSKRTTIRFTDEDLQSYVDSCGHAAIEPVPEEDKPRRSAPRPVLKHLKF